MTSYRVSFLVHRPRRQRRHALYYLDKLLGDATKAANALKNGYLDFTSKARAVSIAREMEGVKDWKVSQFVFNCSVWEQIGHRH